MRDWRKLYETIFPPLVFVINFCHLWLACHFVESEQLYSCWELFSFPAIVLYIVQVKVITCVCVILSLRHTVAGANACHINLSSRQYDTYSLASLCK
jgi:hypothetical protein